MLDVDHGTYPFVTSSSTIAGGAIVGTGLAPNRLTGVLGIVRTYTTRVGEGPFPTEMLEGEAEMGQLIRERGREYGASTGRPRRCGWFDAFATRYAAEINGFTSVALTKLDVLDALEEIKVCIGYKLDGRDVRIAARCLAGPAPRRTGLRNVARLARVQRVGTTEMSALPANARRYVEFLSETDWRRDRIGLHRPRTLADDRRSRLRRRALAATTSRNQSNGPKSQVSIGLLIRSDLANSVLTLDIQDFGHWTFQSVECHSPCFMWADSSVGRATGF